MMKTSIGTSPAPHLFSAGILSSGKTLEISGQIGIKDGKVLESFEEQTKQAFMNVLTVLQSGDLGLEHLTKVRIYLIDMTHYATLNEIYAKVFAHVTPTPTRVAIGVSELPLGALVELDCTATTATGETFSETF